MSVTDILAILNAAQQLVQIAINEKRLLESNDLATVNAALASLQATSDAMHQAAQSI